MMKMTPANVRSAHNLVELLGLLTCVVFLASCSKSEGLGALPKAVGAADEGFAIQALRTIASAETQMKVTRGSFGDFEALTQAGYLDQRFAATGSRHFYLDSSDNAVHANPKQPASKDDPVAGT